MSDESTADRGSAARPALTFRPEQRIRRSQDFTEIYAAKQRVGNPDLVVFGRINGLPHTRIGLSVSRRHGNSVVRHRLRRILRESFRLEQHHLPQGLDLILIPGKESGELNVDRCRRSLRKLSQRLLHRLNGR